MGTSCYIDPFHTEGCETPITTTIDSNAAQNGIVVTLTMFYRQLIVSGGVIHSRLWFSSLKEKWLFCMAHAAQQIACVSCSGFWIVIVKIQISILHGSLQHNKFHDVFEDHFFPNISKVPTVFHRETARLMWTSEVTISLEHI